MDALADDGVRGITVIAFVGSVFSPYYAWQRARGRGDAADHCAVNVALYGAPSRWAMTERGAYDVHRQASSLVVGASALEWRGDRLVIELRERGAPVPHAIRGTVTVDAHPQQARPLALDAAGRHLWHPVAPCARVRVDLTHPRITWEGAGYCDANTGDEPLEHAFASWHWSRTRTGDDAFVAYDVRERGGAERAIALRFGTYGLVGEEALPPLTALPRSRWGIERAARGGDARVVRTLLDAPFYARSLVTARRDGAAVLAMHESLDLERLRAPWVRMLLPFRMPRIARA